MTRAFAFTLLAFVIAFGDDDGTDPVILEEEAEDE